MTRGRRLAAGLTALAAVGVPATVPAIATSRTMAMNIHATAHMVDGGGATLVQEGTFTGAPLGHGTVRVRTRPGAGRGATVRFRLSTHDGSVTGTGDCTLTFKGTQILYRGTAKITGGTGALRGMRANRLTFNGRGDIAGEKFVVDLAGHASA